LKIIWFCKSEELIEERTTSINVVCSFELASMHAMYEFDPLLS
jgi:hypothetical protein